MRHTPALSPVTPPSRRAEDCASMPEIRAEIDRIDEALVALLAERMTFIERAGIVKGERGAVRDEARIRDVLTKVEKACADAGFPFAIAEPLWRHLIEASIAHEFKVFDARAQAPAARARR
ncbi:MAG: chorismate mutase [Alphaproteobacteria bacterium]|nr:chorismate mutase [Alphaproteobacteria bacterium]